MASSDTTVTGRDDLRSAIVGAAEQLLRDGGRHAVTTRAVAGAAGVQAPTIYRLFGDKDGLLEAVAERVMGTYVAAKSDAAGSDAAKSDAAGSDAAGSEVGAEDDPVADLRAGWRRHIDFGLANPELFVLLVEPRRARASAASRAGVAVLRQRIDRLAAAGLLRVDQELATSIVHSAATGVILTLLAQDPAERRSTLAETTLEAVLDRILGGASRTSSARGAGLAIAFGTTVDALPGLSEAERTLMAEWVARSVRHLQSSSADAGREGRDHTERRVLSG